MKAIDSMSSLWNWRQKNSIISIFESIASGADRHGIAIVTEDDVKVSYESLNSKAINISEAILKTIGTDGNAHLVGIMLERDIGFVASALAILKAGGTYVPVDPSFPPDRQSHILGHSNSELVITDKKQFDIAKSRGVVLPTCLIIDPTSCEILRTIECSQRVNPNKSLQGTEDKLAYVLYTSGSTGKPKGVVLKCDAVLNIVEWFANELKVDKYSKVLGLTTFCFDISVLETFLPLIRGGTLVLAKSSTQKDPFRLREVIEDFKVTVFQATPTSYEMLLATGWSGDPTIDFLVGGEACRPTVLPIVHNCRSLRNVYGPTETCIWSSSYTITRDFANDVASTIKCGGTAPAVPIGKPISATDFYVVNIETMKPCPAGTEGELWIGGVGVALGYLNAPDITEKVFIKNPFGPGFVYRTGDVARLREDGNYVFSRRIDDQVKIDGYRIELAEIEVVYMQNSLVEQAVALVRSNKLVLYIKTKKVISPKELENIHDAAKLALPHYMVPKNTVFVEEFPQTANGKLDRKALPDPPAQTAFQNPSTHDSDFSPSEPGDESMISLLGKGPKTDSKRTVASIVCDVVEELRGSRPAPSATLAALGVDSLGSVMLVRRLSDTFDGIRITPVSVFGAGLTIAAFAVKLRSRLETDKADFLLKLNLDPESGAEDVESGSKSIEDNDDTQVQGANKAEMAFDEMVADNIKFFEGLRGFLALLVLWEHYHDPKYEINFALATNSLLFMIVAGFTVALQYRVLPVHIGRQDSGVRLLPRKIFDGLAFLKSKYLGIYPMLWFTLLICIPNWYMNEPKHQDIHYCYYVWIFGLQEMDVNCRANGPYGIWFASALIVVFLYYTVLRFIFSYVQDVFIQWRQKDFVVPFSNPNNIERQNKPKSWKEYIGNSVGRLCYNRPTVRGSVYLTILWFALAFFWFYLALIFKNKLWKMNEKSPLINLPYFICGAACASLVECWHFSIQSSSTIDEVVYGALVSIVGTTNSFWRPTEIKIFAADVKNVVGVIWRFLPDIIACVFALLLSNYGELGTDDVARFNLWVTLPLVFLGYVFVSMLQRKNSSMCLTRYILETSFFGACGYSSLNLFLFQHIFLEFYCPWFDTGTIWMKSAKNKWFHKQPISHRLFYCLALLCVSYFMQWLIQDRIVVYLYGKYIEIRKQFKSGGLSSFS